MKNQKKRADVKSGTIEAGGAVEVLELPVHCKFDAMLAVSALKAHPRNPRKHPKKEIEALAGVIRGTGWRRAVTVSKRSGFVVRGHGAMEAAALLGCKVPVEYQTFKSEREEHQHLIADNRLAELATWNDEALAELLDDLDGDLALTGFDEGEAERLIATFNGAEEGPPAQMEKADALLKKWKVKRGQIWASGKQLIACGDSSVSSEIDHLIHGKCELVFTDPPYGHNNNNGDLIHNWEAALGKKKTPSSAARPIQNDGPEANPLVRKIFSEAARLLKPGCCCCCCCGGGGPDPQFARWSLWLDAVIPFKMCVIWDKGGLGMGWHYRRNWECVLIAEQPGKASHWFGGNDVPNVIRDIGKIIPSKDDHPTPKPTALAEFFIKLHSRRGDVVWDPFLGSGTTLVACEQLGRCGRGMEIEPCYVAVALERLADMGLKPKLVG